MFSLSLTESARQRIRDLLRGTTVPAPIIYLIEASRPEPAAPDVRDAIARGEDESRVRQVASKDLPDDWMKRPRTLHAAIYPKKQLSKLFLRRIDDIVFYVPPQLAKKIDGCILDFGAKGFQVMNTNGVVVMPSQ